MPVYVLGRGKTCPICGKSFVLPVQNTYRMVVNKRVVDCCSYTCFRKLQKKEEEAKGGA